MQVNVKSLSKLSKAAWEKDVGKLQTALKKADVEETDKFNRTALHYASWSGSVDCVTRLLSNGAKTRPDSNGATPLTLALHHRNYDCVQALLRDDPTVSSLFTALLSVSDDAVEPPLPSAHSQHTPALLPSRCQWPPFRRTPRCRTPTEARHCTTPPSEEKEPTESKERAIDSPACYHITTLPY